MQEIHFLSGPLTFKLRSKGDLLEDLVSDPFLRDYIPGVRINPADDSRYIISIMKNDKSSRWMSLGGNSATLNVQKSFSTKDIISLIDYVLELWRQENGVYTVHGAAASFNGRGVLVIGGASGVGKSTLINTLCKIPGFVFWGDEKIMLDDSGNIIGGIGATGRAPAKIRLIIQPVIGAGKKLEFKQWSGQKVDWHLYEELSRKIRGTSRRVGKGLPIESVDTIGLASARSKLAQRLANSSDISSYTLYGDANSMTEFIKTRLL